MEAGKELDALVAEKVMGWRELRIVGDRIWGMAPDRHRFADACLHTGLRAEITERYSTDIAAAWEVVEKLYAEGYWAQLQTPWNEPGGEANVGHSCGFTPFLTTGWNGIPDYWTQAEMMPLAICLAALKTKGIDIDIPDGLPC